MSRNDIAASVTRGGEGTWTTARGLRPYDAFATDVRLELERTAGRMDELRAAGQVKTATVSQLFANRATLRDIDRRLAERGL